MAINENTMDRVFYAYLDDDSDGIRFISLVDQPAIEENYLLFNKQIKFSKDDNTHCLTGPILIPNQKIYRRDDKGEYYIVFEADTIEKVASRMITQGTAAKVDTHHNNQLEEGIYPIEIYLKDSKRNTLVGFEDLPDKTLFVTYKVENEELYQKIKDDFKGFSIEALFTLKEIPTETEELQEILSQLKKLRNIK